MIKPKEGRKRGKTNKHRTQKKDDKIQHINNQHNFYKHLG